MSKSKKSSLGDVEFNDTEVDEWDEEDLIKAENDSRVPGEPQARGDHRRDWRDAEKYREERELRRQIDDLFWFDTTEKADRRGRPRS